MKIVIYSQRLNADSDFALLGFGKKYILDFILILNFLSGFCFPSLIRNQRQIQMDILFRFSFVAWRKNGLKYIELPRKENDLNLQYQNISYNYFLEK